MLGFKILLPKINRICSRIISSTMVAGIGLGFGLVPKVSFNTPTISFSLSATAQEFTPEEIANYAKAGYEVELLRREIYKEIKTSINEPPPNIVCDRPETFQELQPEIREVAGRYCQRSQQIVRENNLSIDRFNELKSYYDRRDDFYQQVQNTLIELQK